MYLKLLIRSFDNNLFFSLIFFLSLLLGGMHDYNELPGIAHFLEHMLFMGSKKYPTENYFSKFIRDHAGSYNGQTSEGWQNYYFDISFNNLAEALDMYV